MEAKLETYFMPIAQTLTEGGIMECKALKVKKAAQNLFDNRLGWSDGRSPYAPKEFWYQLGVALYGKKDKRVQDLSKEDKAST